MGSAALIVANGLGLEESMADIIDAVESEGVPVATCRRCPSTRFPPAPTTTTTSRAMTGTTTSDRRQATRTRTSGSTRPGSRRRCPGDRRRARRSRDSTAPRSTSASPSSPTTRHARRRRRDDRRVDPRRPATARHQPRLAELLRRPVRLRDPRQRHPVAELAERHQPGRTRGPCRRHRSRPASRRSSPRPSTRRPTRRRWPTESATSRWSPSRPTRSVSPAATPPPTSPGCTTTAQTIVDALGTNYVMEFLTDPWGWWIAPFVDNQFMRDALLAGILTVITTSLVGTWVVLRGMSFLGDALAHGVLPGIAVAFIIGVNTSIGAFVAAGAMVLGISVIRRHSPLPDDTSIGVLFVGFLALAVVIMSTQQASYVGDLNRFLFGSITGVDDADLIRQAHRRADRARRCRRALPGVPGDDLRRVARPHARPASRVRSVGAARAARRVDRVVVRVGRATCWCSRS